MAHDKIVTMFNTVAQAEGAKRSLLKAGFPDSDIDILSGERLESEGHAVRHPGLWQRLFGDTVDDEQAGVYDDALESGGVVLSLRADEDQLPRALTILDAHDSVDFSRRNNPDYTDTTGSVSDAAPSTNPIFTGERDDVLTASQGAASPTGNESRPLRTSLTGDESEEEVLRLAEEQLEVGKRLVSEGSTRVRRYTVTDEVSEQISLREQHADIFRRSINEPAHVGDVDWSEKTVEVAETHEQPVINKTAQVKEEVVVRTDANERVETVSDTVRRQEVDIDHTAPETLASDVATTGTDTTDLNTTGRSATGLGAAAAETSVSGVNTTGAGAADLGTPGAGTAGLGATGGVRSDDEASTVPGVARQDQPGVTSGSDVTGNKKESFTDKVGDKVEEVKDKFSDKDKPR